MTINDRVKRLLSLYLKPASVGLVSFLLSNSILANPVLDNIAHGQITIQQTPGTTVVNQTSQKGIINWQSFNIGATEHTHFQQPTGGATLNRINPAQGASQIYGRLTATGQIILVNPAGVYFGPGSYVNVGGLIASTANITDQDFLNNYYRFTKDNVDFNGAIVNQGTIIAAEHGLVALIGGAVSNEGYIEANLGQVVLASGNAFSMSFAGNELVSFAVDAGVSQKAVDNNGNTMHDGVSQSGTIAANGGRIIVSARDASRVLDHIINMSGYIEAKSVYQQNGEIIISGDPHAGTVRVASKMKANGNTTGSKGGKIDITGYNIVLDNTAELDVSGDIGGGTINIGGNHLGKGPLPNANAVVMLPGATINASAFTSGNGGDVTLWSDYYTEASGFIAARGGSISGDGGTIETSSKNILSVGEFQVDARAANGKSGQWLLDPYNLTVSSSASVNVNYDGAHIFTPTGAGSNILNTSLNSTLNGNTYVTLTTDESNTPTGTVAPGAEAGNITINAPITWSSGANLYIYASGNININASITPTTVAAYLEMATPGTLNQTATIDGLISQLYLYGGGTYNLSQANSFSGSVKVDNSIITFNSIGDAGTNSSFGNSTNYIDASIGSKLTYTGTGHSTSRIIYVTLGTTIEASGSGTLTLTNATPIQAAFTTGGSQQSLHGIILSGTGTGHITGLIESGLGNVHKTGSGTWILSGNNTYLGSTNIHAGTLQIGNGGTSGTVAGSIVNNGALIFNRSDNLSFDHVISGTGSLTKNGTGTLTLSGINSYTGSTTVNNGTLSFNSIGNSGTNTALGNSSGAINLGAATLQYTGLGHTSSRAITLTATGATIDASGTGALSLSGGVTGAFNMTLTGSGNAEQSGVIGTGSGTLTKSGAGTWILSGNNTSTGATTISAGTLQVGSGGASGALTTSGITNNSALIYNTSANFTFANVISGTGSLTQNGSGTTTLTAANTYSGATTINNGGITFSGANGAAASSSSWTINQGARLRLDNNAANNTNRIANNVLMNGGEFVFNGANVAATNASESVGTLTLNTGSSIITLNSGTGGSTQLTFSSITRSNNTTALFRGTGLGNTAGAGATNLFFTTATNLNLIGGNTTQTNKPIVPYAIGDTSASGTGLGFATYNINPANNTANTTGIRPLATGTEYATTSTAGANILINGIALSPNANVTYNSLAFAGASTYTIGSGGGLKTSTITSGAIFAASGATAVIGGRANDTLAFAAVERVVTAVGSFTHNTTNLTGTGGLVKAGAGTYTENIATATTGGIVINAGTLTNGINSAFTSQALTVYAGGTLSLNGFTNTFTSLTLESGQTGAAVTTDAGTLTLGGNVTSTVNGAGTNAATITGNLALGATRTFTVNAGTNSTSDLTINAVISGSGFGLNKSGAGILTLGGTNTYTNITTINAGTIKVSADANLGAAPGSPAATQLTIADSSAMLSATGSFTLNTNRGITFSSAGAIDVASGATLTYDGAIASTVGMNKTGLGTLLLTANQTYTGDTTITNGTLQLGSGSTTGSVSGNIANNGTLVINRSDSFTLGNAISGIGNLTHAGTGTITISSANTHTGGTTINSGATLSVGNVNALGTTGAITVNAGGQLTLALVNTTFGNNSTLTLNGTGTGTEGALFIQDSASNNYLYIFNQIRLSGSATISSGLGRGTNFADASIITGSGFDLTLKTSSSGSGSAINNFYASLGTGSGGLTLTSPNTNNRWLMNGLFSTYTGATSINGGHVGWVGNNQFGSSSSINVSSATTFILSPISYFGRSTGSGQTVDSYVTSGINAVVSYSNPIILNGGIVSVDAPTTLAAPIQLAANQTINISGNTVTLNGVVSGSGNLNLTAALAGKILKLAGSNTYTGTTTVSSGTLEVTHVNGLGGATGGAVTVSGGARLRINLGGATLLNSTASSITLNGNGGGPGALYFSGLDGITDTIRTPIILGSATTIGANSNGSFASTATINNAGFLLTLGTGVGAGNLSLNGIVSGAGGLTVNLGSSSSVATLAAVNTYAGATTITNGLVSIAADSGLGTAPGVATAGHLIFNSGGTPGLITTASFTLNSNRGIALNNNSVINVSSGTLTYGGIIAGASALTKDGAGTLTLSGANTYTGSTTVSAGTLVAANATALGTTAAGTSVTSGATLNINGVAIGAEDITLNGTGVGGAGALTSTGSSSLAGLITLGSTSSIASTSGTFTISNAGFITGSGFGLTLDGAGDGSLVSRINTDAGTVTKSGAGTWTLSGVNLYTGNTTVSAGTLVAANAAALGTTFSGTSITSGATLNINNVAIGAEAITLNGTGVGGAGALTSTGISSYAGLITLGSTSSIASTSGTFTINNASTITGSGFGLTLDGAGDGSLASRIGTGAGTVTKSGSGTWTLEHTANTYTGATSITSGTLSVNTIANGGVSSSLGATAAATPIAISGSSILSYTGGTGSMDREFSISGTGGTIRATAAGTMTLSGAINNAGTTLTFDTNTGNITASGVISNTGALTKSNAGTLILSNNNTYSGGTTINAGTVQVGAGGATGAITGAVVNNGTLIFNTSNSFTLANTISGTGSLTQSGSGTVTISATNTYTGATSITSGVLSINSIGNSGTNTAIGNSSGAINIGAGTLQYTGGAASSLRPFVLTANGATLEGSGTGALTLSGGITGAFNLILTGTATGANASVQSGVIGTGAGTVTKSGTGQWTLSNAANTYTGATSITGGTLSVGTIANGGTNSSLGATAAATPIALSGGGILSYTGGTGSMDRQFSTSGTGGSILATAAGTLTLSGAIANAGTTLTFDTNTGNITASGIVSGVGAVAKSSAGILILSNNNTYSGGTTINAGTLQVGAGGATGAITGAIVDNGALVFNTSNSFTLSNTISGTGSLTQSGSGTVTISGTNTYTGATSINSGTLSINSIGNSGTNTAIGNSSAAINLGAGTLQYTGSGHSSLRPFTLTANGATIDASGSGALTLSGAVSGAFNMTLTGTSTAANTMSGVIGTGAGTLTKSSTGTWTLSNAANTYTGATSITGGTLSVSTVANGGTNSSLGATAATTPIAISGGILSYTGGTGSMDRQITTSGAGGTIVATAAGTLTLSGAIANAGTTLTFDTNTGNITASGIVSGVGALAKFSAGTLILSNNNTYSGGTTINAGTLQVGAGGATGAITGAIVDNGALIFNTSNSFTLSNTISGTGSLTQSGSGTVTISGTNTYTGATSITGGVLSINTIGNSGTNTAIGNSSAAINLGAGTLQYTGAGHTSSRAITLTASGGTINASGSGALTLSGGVTGNTFNLTLSGTGNGTQSGVIATTTGTVTKNGTGTWTLTGANTYSGTTTINTGILNLQNSTALGTGAATVASGATLQLSGNSGTSYTIGNNMTFNANGRLVQIIANGSSTLSGNIAISGSTIINISVPSGSSSLSLTGALTGSGAISKIGIGNGVLKFNGNGSTTYTGAVTASTGTVELGSSTALASGASLTLQSLASLTVNNTSGLSLPTNITFSAGSTGTLISTSTGTNILSGTLTLTSGNLIRVNSGSLTLSGVVSGTNLTLNGTGTLTLSNANTYTGTTTVNGGTLSISNISGINNTALVVNSGTTFNITGALAAFTNGITLNSGTITTNANNTLSGTIAMTGSNTFSPSSGTLTVSNVVSGSGASVTMAGAGTLLFSNANTYTGTTTVNSGTLSISNVSGINNTALTVNTDGVFNITGALTAFANGITLNGGSITTNASNTLSGTIATTGSNTLTPSSGTLTLSNVVSGTGSLTMNGAGTLSLTAANTYSGGTTVSGGTLSLGISSTGSVTNGPFGTGTLTMNGGTLITSGAFAIANAYTISGSTVIGGSNTVTLSGIGTLNAALTNSNSSATTLSGSILGTGAINQNSGMFILSGSNTGLTSTTSYIPYTGAITIGAGATLSVTNAAGLGNATVTATGNTGTLNINNVTITTGNALTLNNGILSTTGTAGFNGQVTLTGGTTNSYAIASGSTFTQNSNVDGAATMTFGLAGGFWHMNGEVGTVTPLTSQTMTATPTFGGTAIYTTGNQYFNTPITLVNDVDFFSQFGNIYINSTVNGPHPFVVSAGGQVVIQQGIGQLVPVSSVSLTGSIIRLNGGTIASTGGQSYTGIVIDNNIVNVANPQTVNTNATDITSFAKVQIDANVITAQSLPESFEKNVTNLTPFKTAARNNLVTNLVGGNSYEDSKHLNDIIIFDNQRKTCLGGKNCPAISSKIMILK